MFSYYYAGNYLTGFWAVKHLSKVLLPVRWLATEVGDTRSLFCDLGNNWNVHEWHLRGSRGARPRLVFFLIRSKESHMWATPGQPKINNLLSNLVTSSSCGCLATKTICMDYGGRKTFFKSLILFHATFFSEDSGRNWLMRGKCGDSGHERGQDKKG